MSASDENLQASVIIPVYNKEQYLETCFKTLEAQTLDKNHFEAIFIDDGSRDGSLGLLKAFAEGHPWVKVIAKENGGVCSARNAGIREAKGRYLFYLDPDDEWTPDVLDTVSKFFDKHYDQVDLVTYPIVPYTNGEKQAQHYRYETLISTGVYNLLEGENWLVTQTTMNICVKNRYGENRMFDFVSENGVVYHEDQQYITEILIDNPFIGYCMGPKYIWNKNDDSVTNNAVKPYYVYNNTMTMYEHLYALCEGNPPQFLQSMLVHDLGWKMRADAALPTHLSGDEYEVALGRLKALLRGVDDEVILSHPNVHLYHRFFLLRLKWDEDCFSYEVGAGGITLTRGGKVIYVENRVEINILRTRTTERGLFMVGLVKSPTFSFIDKEVELYIIKNAGGVINSQRIHLDVSSWSRLGTKSVIARNYVFRLCIPFGQSLDTKFILRINGIDIPMRFTYLANRVNFSPSGKQAFVQDGHMVELKSGKGIISVRKLERSAELAARNQFGNVTSRKVTLSRRAVYMAKDALKKLGRRIWIYGDTPGRLDNGWYQFEHDCVINDGVSRYYVTHDNRPPLPKGATHAAIIRFGSRIHRFLYLLAEKVLCSDITRVCVMPWSAGRRKYYADFDNPQLIYLQHGVLWAHMPWYYSYDRVLFDKEVVSTQFEIENLVSNYGFEESDLIGCGMPRYDLIEHDVAAKKKILLCPSWRSYLIGEIDKQGHRTPLTDKFISSSYFKGLEELLCSERLGALLEEYGYELVLKLHPNFACYENCFKRNNPLVTITSERIVESDYAVIITDYSSYSFDFAYLGRALIYYITDIKEFRAGLNNYNELDMDLEDALGEYAHSADEVMDALERVLNNDGTSFGRYAERESGFFLHYDNMQRDRLYRVLYTAEC